MIIKKHHIYLDSPRIVVYGRKEDGNDPKYENISLELEKVSIQIEKAKKRAEEIVSTAKKQADDILSQAKSQAKQLIADTELEKEKILDRAHRKLQQIETLVSNFDKSLQEQLLSISDDLIQIIETLLRRVLFYEINVDNVNKKLQSLLRKLSAMRTVQVYLCSEDVSKLDDDLHKHMESKGVKIKIDPHLKPGEVVIDTELGTIDARNESIKQSLEDFLAEVFGSAESQQSSKDSSRKS